MLAVVLSNRSSLRRACVCVRGFLGRKSFIYKKLEEKIPGYTTLINQTPSIWTFHLLVDLLDGFIQAVVTSHQIAEKSRVSSQHRPSWRVLYPHPSPGDPDPALKLVGKSLGEVCEGAGLFLGQKELYLQLAGYFAAFPASISFLKSSELAPGCYFQEACDCCYPRFGALLSIQRCLSLK